MSCLYVHLLSYSQTVFVNKLLVLDCLGITTTSFLFHHFCYFDVWQELPCGAPSSGQYSEDGVRLSDSLVIRSMSRCWAFSISLKHYQLVLLCCSVCMKFPQLGRLMPVQLFIKVLCLGYLKVWEILALLRQPVWRINHWSLFNVMFSFKINQEERDCMCFLSFLLALSPFLQCLAGHHKKAAKKWTFFAQDFLFLPSLSINNVSLS